MSKGHIQQRGPDTWRLKFDLGTDPLTGAFSRLVARTDVPKVTLHGLRHTHISHLLMEGVHVEVVSERAGHSSVSITLDRYSRVIPTMQAAAAKLVDMMIGEALQA